MTRSTLRPTSNGALCGLLFAITLSCFAHDTPEIVLVDQAGRALDSIAPGEVVHLVLKSRRLGGGVQRVTIAGVPAEALYQTTGLVVVRLPETITPGTHSIVIEWLAGDTSTQAVSVVPRKPSELPRSRLTLRTQATPAGLVVSATISPVHTLSDVVLRGRNGVIQVRGVAPAPEARADFGPFGTRTWPPGQYSVHVGAVSQTFSIGLNGEPIDRISPTAVRDWQAAAYAPVIVSLAQAVVLASEATGHADAVEDVRKFLAARYVASSDDHGGNDPTRVATLIRQSVQAHRKLLEAFAFSPDSTVDLRIASLVGTCLQVALKWFAAAGGDVSPLEEASWYAGVVSSCSDPSVFVADFKNLLRRLGGR